MVEPMHYCFFLQISSLAALCTVSGPSINVKFVCEGNNIEVFENITSISLNTEITFYRKRGNKTETIALWTMINFNYTGKIEDTYKQKVSLENENILLKDFQSKDEATYVMMYQTGMKEVQLCVLTPPTLSCKLDIIQEKNFLFALLKNTEFCGKPQTSATWMKHPNVSYIDSYMIEVPAGNQPVTYRACIKGEALKCVTDSLKSYYCTNYTTEFNGESRANCTSAVTDNCTHTCALTEEIPLLKNVSAVTVIFVFFIAIAILTIQILIHRQKLTRRCRRKKDRSPISRHDQQGEIEMNEMELLELQ